MQLQEKVLKNLRGGLRCASSNCFAIATQHRLPHSAKAIAVCKLHLQKNQLKNLRGGAAMRPQLKIKV
jgi:hypothetical protein